MKKMRSVFAFLMAVAMLLSLTAVAFAADEELAEEEVVEAVEEPAADEADAELDGAVDWTGYEKVGTTKNNAGQDVDVYKGADGKFYRESRGSAVEVAEADITFTEAPADDQPADDQPAEEDKTDDDSAPDQQHGWGKYLYFQDLANPGVIISAAEMTEKEEAILKKNPNAKTRDDEGLPTCLLIVGDEDGEYIGYYRADEANLEDADTTNPEDIRNLTTALLKVSHKWDSEDPAKQRPESWGKLVTAADCTKEGKYQDYCQICGQTRDKFRTTPAGHKWSSEVENNGLWGKVIEEPTCQKEGKAQDICLKCGEMGTKFRTIAKVDHNLVAEITAPVCQSVQMDDAGNVTTVYKNGTIELSCSFCGYKPATLTADEGYFAFENEDGDPVVTSTKVPTDVEPNENGEYINGKIDVTIDYYKELTGDRNYDGHSWTNWNEMTPATCEKEGFRYRMCTRCGMDQHEVIPAKGHTPVYQYSYVIDCFSAYDVYTCKDCGKVLMGYWKAGRDVIAKYEDAKNVRGAKFVAVKDATSIVRADALIAASNAEALKMIYEVEAHTYDLTDVSTVDVDATVALYKENNPDTELSDQQIKEALFEFRGPTVSKIKTPKCNEPDAQIVFKCKYSDSKYVVNPEMKEEEHPEKTLTIAHADHSWKNWKLDNTAVDTDGTTWYHYVRYCSVCDAKEDYNSTFDPNDYPADAIHAAADCTMEYAEVVSSDAASCTAGGKVVKICPICKNMVEEEVPAIGHHTWNEGEVLSEASCANGGTAGRVLYTCTVCGTLKIDTVAAPAHDVVTVKGYAATVDAAGLTDGKQCKTCGEWIEAQKEIPALKANSYKADTSSVKDKAGKVTFAVDGTVDPGKVWARVAWYYTLSDGSTFAYATMKEVTKDADGNLVADVRGAFAPAGATLDKVLVVITNDADADLTGNYAGAALKTPDGGVVSASL